MRLRYCWRANIKHEDFDTEKQQSRDQARRLTLEQWGELYFTEMINPGLRCAAGSAACLTD